MSKQEFIDVSNFSKGWNFGVYPTLLEASLYSFSHRPLRGPGFQISVLERSYAAAVCSLAAFQIEGMLQLATLGMGYGDKLEEVVKTLNKHSYRVAVEELSIVRDAIAHGHVYRTTIYLDANGLPKSSHNKKMTTFVSKKAEKYTTRNKTNLLRFNVNPSRIDFSDAVLAVAVANLIYKELEGRSSDMPMNKFIDGKGYETKYFGEYVAGLMKNLRQSHVRSLRSKLEKLERIETEK